MIKVKLSHLQIRFVSLAIVLSNLFTVNIIAASNAEELRQLLQLTEYISVDYNSAISHGEIIDQGEYDEMQQFSQIIIEGTRRQFKDQQAIPNLANSLMLAIDGKQTIVSIQKITSDLKKLLLINSPSLSLPKSLLIDSNVTQLYVNNCASCHGDSGQGDGVLSKQFVPVPTDFTDRERAMNRSLLGLYNVVTGGLEGTAMKSFEHLSTKQRWSLAFYVGSLAFKSNTTMTKDDKSQLTLDELVMFSPNELMSSAQKPELGQIENLRISPNLLFVDAKNPLTVTREKLLMAKNAYMDNDYISANQYAVSAYLDGFELIEDTLDTHDAKLRKDIESKLLNLRQVLNASSDLNTVNLIFKEIMENLDKAEKLLAESSMSDGTLFSASFIILLREGLEALLVVIALISILIRSDKSDAIKYVHFGWMSAIFAGIVTWLVAQHLVSISGASREIMEGVAALLASVVLFYVGFWMHSKTQAGQWQHFIQSNINQSLKTGTLWGISGLTFITVYREVFETVLFYQSLLTQTARSQETYLIGGLGAALLVLAVFAGLTLKYSIKIPIGKFFSVTTYILLALSFILAGKAISALQEADIVSISSLPVSFQIDLLGINSTWQGVLMQLTIISSAGFLIIKQRLQAKANV